jgi:hypothetical protein
VNSFISNLIYLKIALTNSSASNALAKVRTPVDELNVTFSPVGAPEVNIVLTSKPPLVTDKQVKLIALANVTVVSPPLAIY